MALGLKKKRKPKKAGQSMAKAPPSPPARMLSVQPAVSERRRRFVEAYLISHNASDAARKAGYSKKTAAQIGTRLLRDAQIAAEIRERQAVMTEQAGLTAEMVLAEVAKIAFASTDDFLVVGPDGSPRVDFRRSTRAQRAALASVTVEEFVDGRSDKRQVRRVKFSMNDKVKALGDLMDHFGLKKQKIEVDHKHEITLMGELMQEIDAASRGKVIEHEPAKK